jgi:hypothetical protein
MSCVAVTPGPTAAVDYFASSPLDDPLSYPGAIPPHSFLLVGPGQLRKLRLLSAPEGRRAVVAVGSNAAPAQLVRKFAPVGLSCVVPVIEARVTGLRILPSAHLNPAGYVPWTAAATNSSAEELVSVFVTFLDDAQLARLDETEPNYERVPLVPGRYPVRLAGSDEPLGECDIYLSKHGAIVDDRIVGGGLPSQPVLLQRLLDALPTLGLETPAELLSALRTGQLEAAFVSTQIQEQLRVERSGL